MDPHCSAYCEESGWNTGEGKEKRLELWGKQQRKEKARSRAVEKDVGRVERHE